MLVGELQDIWLWFKWIPLKMPPSPFFFPSQCDCKAHFCESWGRAHWVWQLMKLLVSAWHPLSDERHHMWKVMLLAVFLMTPEIPQNEWVQKWAFPPSPSLPTPPQNMFIFSVTFFSDFSCFLWTQHYVCACDSLHCLWVFRVWKPPVKRDL